MERGTLKTEFDTPDWCFTVPGRGAIREQLRQPQRTKPALFRRVIFDLMRLVIDQAGHRRGMLAKGKTSHTLPAFNHLLRARDHHTRVYRLRNGARVGRPVDEVFFHLAGADVPARHVYCDMGLAWLKGDVVAENAREEQEDIR